MSEKDAGQENAGQENAKTKIPEAFKGTAALADFKDVEALGEAYVSLKSYQGSSIRIPTDEAGDDQRKEFYGKLASVDGVMLKPDFSNKEQSGEFFKTLGKPDDIKGYEFDAIDGYTPNEDKMNQFKALALENNLTKSQASKMAKTMMEQDINMSKESRDAMELGKKNLKTEWGMAYDQNSGIALSVAKATKAPEYVIDAIEAGNADPNLVKWMHSLSKKFEGEGQQLMEKEQKRVHATPDEIKDQMSDIRDNKDHPYYNANHPDHHSALMKMLELQQKLNG